MDSKKLFVGNLSFTANDSQLKGLFEQAGTVESATVINDKYSGRSKGFGFVEMSTLEEAQKAIDTLNGYELDGRKLNVSEARPLTERKPRDDRDGFRRRSFDN
ncbi:MAG: RNA-binding protein [Candidatus Paceibacterota bacterium]|jgi:RNA recognition motif-containing protein